MMPATNWQRRFSLAHGNKPISISPSWYLFEDAAMCERNTFGAAIEPPTDKRRRAELILLYREVAVKRAEDVFEELKAKLTATFDDTSTIDYSGPIYERSFEEGLAELRALRGTVMKARRLLQQAQSAHEQSSNGHHADEHDSDERIRELISNLRI